MKQKREREEPCEVCGHYHDYHGGEPCAICGHKLELPGAAAATSGGGVEPPSVKPPSAFPSEIVPGFLYLGSYDHASRHEILKTLGVGNILNTVPGCQALYKNSFTYHTVSASPPPFEECYDFLSSVQQQGGRVLVHCMTGVSRSPTIVIYFLMRRNSWRLSEAYTWVKDRRQQIAITAADAQRLQQAEREVLGPNASGFQVPVGQQAAPAASQQQHGAGPFGWPAFGGSSMGIGGTVFGGGAGAGGVPALAPAQQPSLNFGAPQGGGAFVFGASHGQQQQQQQQNSVHDMMD